MVVLGGRAGRFRHCPDPQPPLSGPYQYGWFDLNLDAAWQLAGYALVGVIDNGLDPDNAAFRQFNGATYLGGGFQSQASRDVGLAGGETILGIPPQSPLSGPTFEVFDRLAEIAGRAVYHARPWIYPYIRIEGYLPR